MWIGEKLSTSSINAHKFGLCCLSGMVKYLYKYITGHDRAIVSFIQNKGENENNGIREINEPAQYLDARYIGAMEASWRLKHFEMHGRLPAVKALAIHQKGQQKVNFEDGEVIMRPKKQKIPHSLHTLRRHEKTQKPLIYYIALRNSGTRLESRSCSHR